MTLKLERATTWTQKRLNLAWYHHLTHITCVQKLRGLRQNWVHFVYKLDHLFQSTRVSDENSSATKTFHFSKLVSTQDFFLHRTCNIQCHVLKFQPFLTSFGIFHAFNDLFSAKWPSNWKALQSGLRKGWNLAWYYHLTHITCVRKLRGLGQKLDALRVQTRPSLSKYKGFRRKLICYKDISFF